ncbi:MAG: hypothetical protein KC931_20670, partial [Candidatus Omnitrophica bacterium]|nr:hypothetical protein [Candidatus Omnitrophota bacterium]
IPPSPNRAGKEKEKERKWRQTSATIAYSFETSWGENSPKLVPRRDFDKLGILLRGKFMHDGSEGKLGGEK